MSRGHTTAHLERCLNLLEQGDESARTMLLEFAGRRLRIIAERTFRDFSELQGYEQPDDLFQDAQLRLWRALEKVHPTTVAGFMGLAAKHTRYALLDLIHDMKGRDYKKPKIVQEDSAIQRVIADPATSTAELDRMYELHQAADRLPEPHRTVFDLLYYEGLTQAEAADLMQISLSTLERLWREVKLKLCKMLDDSLAEL